VCDGVEDESSLYSLPMTVVMVGMVRNALQLSLGCNPGRPRQTLHPMVQVGVRPNPWFGWTMGWAKPPQFRLAASLSPPLSRTVNFGPIGSCHLWVLSPSIDKSSSRQCLIDRSSIVCRFSSVYKYLSCIYVSSTAHSGSRYFIWKLYIASIASLH
jgi:hypothetical protein